MKDNSKTSLIKLQFQPGISRDSTKFNSTMCIDGQGVRFYQGLPRKEGGYELIRGVGDSEIARNLYISADNLSLNTVNTYVGRASSLKMFLINYNGNASDNSNRTPVAFTADENNVWDFENYTYLDEELGIQSLILAHVAATGEDIASENIGPVYYGLANSTDPLVPLIDDNTGLVLTDSGGIVVVDAFIFLYGTNGISWCQPAEPFNWPIHNTQYYNNKIVQGFATKGNGGPAALFWSLNTVIRATYDAGLSAQAETFSVFNFDTIASGISVLSKESIVQAEQLFFWPGVNKFYWYNGSVQELENFTDKEWFYRNLNPNQRTKVWGMYAPQFNEIWWFYPKGSATECTNKITYNIQEQTWYDTLMPRSAGYRPDLYPYPMLASSELVINRDSPSDLIYPIWTHEKGVDRIEYGIPYAIRAYFDTPLICLGESGGDDTQMRTRRIEPDFQMRGQMEVTVFTRPFAACPDELVTVSETRTFLPSTGKIDFSVQGRFTNFRFESNCLGGTFQAGKNMIDITPGDDTPGSYLGDNAE